MSNRVSGQPVWRCVFAGFVLGCCAGCTSIGYYAHLAEGQLRLLLAREPVSRVLDRLEAAPAEDEEAARLKARLRFTQEVLAFAEDRLQLRVGGRYRSYVALDREAVVWNLFAAPELELVAHLWCHPFVGCTPYRGYFDLNRALRDRRRLDQQGFDTYVGSVAAYSTLGWFDDPLLSTFIHYDEPSLAELLLHELAHGRVWVRDDVTFNESFAQFVGRQGMRSFFVETGRDADLHVWSRNRATARAVSGILEITRSRLESVYSSGLTEAEKRAAKTEVLDKAATCLRELAGSAGSAAYRRLASELNNAVLISFATYTDAVPAFERLFDQVQASWPRFFERVEALARLGREERERALASLNQQEIATAGDDERADEVQCESFPRHGLDTEASR